jgi:hypothetical protein
MASRRLNLFRIVLASPTDVEPEWRVVERLVEEFNHGLAAERGLLLRLSTWKTDAHGGFHPEGPQGLIDANLRLEEADLLLALFWTRFGTPVADAESGTQHEILKAVQSWRASGRPQVMVYFKDLPYNPRNQAEHEQWLKVRQFRDNFPDGGLWRSYGTKPQFETQLRRDLTNLLRTRSTKRRSSSKKPAPEGAAGAEPRSDEPIPYTAEFSFIPRSSSNTSHGYTLNVLLSNWSGAKLTDYDVELTFPSQFLGGDRSSVDESVSTQDRAVLRVPMPPNANPPPVFPEQTRNVLSVAYTITTNHVMSESDMLKRADLVVRFADGRSLQVVAP